MKYEVRLSRTVLQQGTMIIDAVDEESASAHALILASSDTSIDWATCELFDDDLEVEDVNLVSR